MPDDDPLQCDFSNSRNHRYRNHQVDIVCWYN